MKTPTTSPFVLVDRKVAVTARLTKAFGEGYGWFEVALVRDAQSERRIRIKWTTFPFEATVIEALGDLYDPDAVTLARGQVWACGRIHTDEMDAWTDHEGTDHLTWFDGADWPILTTETEDELLATGETFNSECKPGNYVSCPTCGGIGGLFDSKTFKRTDCPDCVRFGIDRKDIGRGVLNLDVPEHLTFFQSVMGAVHAEAKKATARTEAKRVKALAHAAAHSAPRWVALPSRAGGLINGLPVAPLAPGCDYLNSAADEAKRSRCRNDARWFDPTTGLRVCTRHKG